jgi:hypothetical protein
MSLPKMTLPFYDIKIPSNGKEIIIRPFTVKEEKILLIAAETKDPNEIINATKQIVNNCIITEGININKLPFFDVDYIFIALRAKSVGDAIDIKYTCNNTTDHGICGSIFSSKIDISNCELVKKEGISMEIILSGTIRAYMKYPNYDSIKALSDKEHTIENKIKLLASSIEKIVDKEKVYTDKDFTKEEMVAFIEGLTQAQFAKLENFIDNMPHFEIVAQAKCGACGFDHTIKYDDFLSFFL